MFNIGDRFTSLGRGYSEIWEIRSRTFLPYENEYTYDLFGVRFSSDHEMLDISEDILKTRYKKIGKK